MNWEKKIEEWVKWIRGNQEKFWAVTGMSLLLILFVGLLIQRRSQEADEAWFQLGTVQSQISQNHLADAAKSLSEWESRFQGTRAAGYASFLKADLAYRTTDYTQAIQIYSRLAQSGRPDVLRPLALSGQIASLEMSGNLAEAQSQAQTFLDKYPDHFLASTMYLTQARIAEAKGDAQAAATIYERLALLFPQSPWSATAKAKAQSLAKK